LGRSTFYGRNVHAYPPPHQLWNHAAISFALLGGGTMNAKIALLFLLGLTVAPLSQAQIKHIEMRVEGMT
jgi:hypothetical protein